LARLESATNVTILNLVFNSRLDLEKWVAKTKAVLIANEGRKVSLQSTPDGVNGRELYLVAGVLVKPTIKMFVAEKPADISLTPQPEIDEL